ncbi:MAG: AMP-binding protein [Prolixibacteraceae bacterium]|nr:AMP-binding protein [Prolixibacteraceae bacterium]
MSGIDVREKYNYSTMNFIEELYNSFKINKSRRAFCSNGQDISYEELLEYINGTRAILNEKFPGTNNPIGIIAYGCIETYAAIFATWFSGNYFVPLNPKHPAERNMSIIKNVGIQCIISAIESVEKVISQPEKLIIIINSAIKSEIDKEPVRLQNNQRLYVLTTSGSTGVPKYVPINVENLTTHCNGFRKNFPELQNDACFLQVYDLTVDASFPSYLIPLVNGACVFTLPEGQFKFLVVAKILTIKQINWVKLTPSVLSFLKSYRDKLDLKHLKYVIFGGEALPLSLVKEWYTVFPNAQIANHYGPTETTVGVTAYRIDDIQNIRSMNGIVSIGKPFEEVECIVINESGEEVTPGENGELCIAGKQVMEGYLNGNDSSFILLEINNRKKKFYRTGDIVQKDNDGYIYYLGRTDDQVKIEGHRINLIEIENKVRNLLPDCQIVMVAHEKTSGLKRLYLFIEGTGIHKMKLKSRLAEQLPPKMIPEEIFLVQKIPLTVGGKIDRIKLANDYLVN